MAKPAKSNKPASLPKAELPANLDPLAAMVIGTLPGIPEGARSGLSAGTHPVDLTLTVRVRGELRIGQDTMTNQVNKLKPWHLARLLANRVPKDVLADCIGMAVDAAKCDDKEDPRVVAMEAESDDIKMRVEEAFQDAGLVVRQIKNGSVRLHGSIEVEVDE